MSSLFIQLKSGLLIACFLGSLLEPLLFPFDTSKIKMEAMELEKETEKNESKKEQKEESEKLIYKGLSISLFANNKDCQQIFFDPASNSNRIFLPVITPPPKFSC